jgi:hypothetical protein
MSARPSTEVLFFFAYKFYKLKIRGHSYSEVCTSRKSSHRGERGIKRFADGLPVFNEITFIVFVVLLFPCY